MDAEQIARADLWVSINRTAERMKRLQQNLSQSVERAMARIIAEEERLGRVNAEGEVIMTPLLLAKMQREITLAFDDMYGSRPGQPSPLETIIVQEAKMARLLALTRAADAARAELGPIKLRLLQEELVAVEAELEKAEGHRRWRLNG